MHFEIENLFFLFQTETVHYQASENYFFHKILLFPGKQLNKKKTRHESVFFSNAFELEARHTEKKHI